MTQDGVGGETIPLLGCDCFLQALDAMMRRSAQGSHVSQSVVEFDRPPDMTVLREGWRAFVHAYPMTVARLGRNWRTLVPVWRVPGEVEASEVPPLEAWQEPGAPGALDQEAQAVESLAALCRMRLNVQRGRRKPEHHVRLDVLERADGTAALVVTWSHLMLDGKGVELLLTELGKRCQNSTSPDTSSETTPAPATLPPAALSGALSGARPDSSMREKMDRSKAFIEHFQQVMGTRFASLGGRKPAPSTVHCRVATLGEAESARVNQRATERTSQLINTPFFFACAARAHDRVFRHRGIKGMPQLVTMPVQTRPKGGAGPIFQNHVSILFFRLLPEDLESVESATRSLQQQFAQMMRRRLDVAFSAMQDILRRVPPRPYMMFLRMQMRGEITSFFHSHTGPFAPELTHLAGATVTNAYHLPVISAPPGTGLFINEHGPRICAAMSWRSGSITEEERRMMFDHFIEDLNGGPIETLTETLEV